jgi:transcriptional regulator with XRE-family HTH domain
MQTELGKELRKLRIDKEERLMQMATRLNVSASFISAVETGKKSPPVGFERQVAAAYDLSAADLQRLCDAADASRVAFTISPTSPLGRNTAGLLARQIGSLSDEQLESIRKILLNSQKGKK